MLGVVVYGTYYVRQRLIAFRNDYCLTCQAPRLALQYRAFEIGHIFWLPILPKGFWKRWVCTSCGVDPHWQLTSNGVKWMGIILLSLLAVAVWTTPPKPDDVAVSWVMRVGLPAAVVALYRGIVRSRRSTERTRAIPPYSEPTCPACQGSLVRRAQGRACMKCGAVQANLKAA